MSGESAPDKAIYSLEKVLPSSAERNPIRAIPEVMNLAQTPGHKKRTTEVAKESEASKS